MASGLPSSTIVEAELTRPYKRVLNVKVSKLSGTSYVDRFKDGDFIG